MEFYRKYRPSLLKYVLGQDNAVSVLKDLLHRENFPHALLLTGPSGTGKTTLARIIANKLECDEDSDFFEVNTADFRGIDMVRDIRINMYAHPKKKSRVYLIDECHQLSKDAQHAMLKILEDPPDHVYFMMATTDDVKLLKTVKNRCTIVKLVSLSPKSLEAIVKDVCTRSDTKISEAVLDRIVECSEGSARKALVLLNAVCGLESESKQLDAILSSDTQRQAIELARALMNPRSKWSDIAKILKDVDDDPEQIRRLILAYADKVLLSGSKLAARAYLVITAMGDPLYDSKPVLDARCYEIFMAK